MIIGRVSQLPQERASAESFLDCCRRLDLADSGLTRGPPPAARQQRMGRPAALGASVSWDGAASRSPRRFIDNTGISSPGDAGETAPQDGAMAGRRFGHGSGNRASRGRCEIEPIDGDDDGSDGTAAVPGTAAHSSRRAAAAGSTQPAGPAVPLNTQQSRGDSAPGSAEMTPVHAPAAGQPRGIRTISRVGLRAVADPRWRTDPRRMAAVRELLQGRARRAASAQGPSAAAADLGSAGAARRDPSEPTSSEESCQQPSDMDAIGALHNMCAMCCN